MIKPYIFYPIAFLLMIAPILSNQLIFTGKKTKALALETKKSGNRNGNYSTELAYKINNEIYYIQTPQNVCFNEYDEVELLVDENNPSNVILSNFQYSYLYYPLTAIFSAVGLIFWIAIYNTYNGKKGRQRFFRVR